MTTITRTYQLEADVLAELRAMDWSLDGLVGKLTRQLDRKTYEKVNKALELMGGSWNRKVGGHVFLLDPRNQVEGWIETGRAVVEKDGFFETPREVVEKMIELAPLPENSSAIYLEPSAGMGAIARVLIERGVDLKKLVLIEKNAFRCEALKKAGFQTVFNTDFTTWISGAVFERIYMNAPYEQGQDIDHTRHAYDLLTIGGILVSAMSEGAFFREDKKATAFREWMDEVEGQSFRLPAGSFSTSGTGVNARLVKIQKLPF